MTIRARCAAALRVTALAFALVAGPAGAATPASIELIYEQLAPSDGAPIVPAIHNDIVYLAAEVRDANGEFVDGVPVTVTSRKGNRRIGPEPVTRDGYTDLTVLAAARGRDTLTISAGPVSTSIDLDVRAPDTAEAYGDALDGVADADSILGWAALMEANLDYDEQFRVSATYPPALQKRFGETVRLVGYMLPLQMSTEQSRFILSANPPVCFFHMPGGPATVVDVHSDGAAEMTWEPIVVEGRLSAESEAEHGLLYSLSDARIINR